MLVCLFAAAQELLTAGHICCRPITELLILHHCLVWFSVAVLNIMNKGNLGRRCFICHTFPGHNLTPREAIARTEAETGGRQPTGLFSGSCSGSFPLYTGLRAQRGTGHCGLGPSTSASRQDCSLPTGLQPVRSEETPSSQGIAQDNRGSLHVKACLFTISVIFFPVKIIFISLEHELLNMNFRISKKILSWF